MSFDDWPVTYVLWGGVCDSGCTHTSLHPEADDEQYAKLREKEKADGDVHTLITTFEAESWEHAKEFSEREAEKWLEGVKG